LEDQDSRLQRNDEHARQDPKCQEGRSSDPGTSADSSKIRQFEEEKGRYIAFELKTRVGQPADSTKYSTDNIETLRIHYMARYWQIRKGFLNYLEDFTTQDSLIGSTICNTSTKHESSVSKVSSPSVLADDTEISKTQKSLMLVISILSI
jgi:hypothetical protein